MVKATKIGYSVSGKDLALFHVGGRNERLMVARRVINRKHGNKPERTRRWHQPFKGRAKISLARGGDRVFLVTEARKLASKPHTEEDEFLINLLVAYSEFPDLIPLVHECAKQRGFQCGRFRIGTQADIEGNLRGVRRGIKSLFLPRRPIFADLELVINTVSRIFARSWTGTLAQALISAPHLRLENVLTGTVWDVDRGNAITDAELISIIAELEDVVRRLEKK